MHERLKAAKVMQDMVPECPVIADNMDNKARRYYGACYERLYIVLYDVIVYAGEPGPIGYNMEEVEKWLETYSS